MSEPTSLPSESLPLSAIPHHRQSRAPAILPSWPQARRPAFQSRDTSALIKNAGQSGIIDPTSSETGPLVGYESSKVRSVPLALVIGERVQIPHQAFQAIFQHMGVDLGGGNVGMS